MVRLKTMVQVDMGLVFYNLAGLNARVNPDMGLGIYTLLRKILMVNKLWPFFPYLTASTMINFVLAFAFDSLVCFYRVNHQVWTDLLLTFNYEL